MSEVRFDSFIKNTIDVHISEIRHGDTILHLDGNIRTVSRSNIRRDSFMGISIFGDSYRLGRLPVKKLNLEVKGDKQ